MSQQSTYQAWRNAHLGQVVGDGQCVAALDGNNESYSAALFPGVNWTAIFTPVNGAKDLAGHSNNFVTWIANDHNNPNQLPEQGDVMVFGATPASGYTNITNNPYGHAGICDSATTSEYALCQQNAPHNGSPLNITSYPWKYRPCLGWYRTNLGSPVADEAVAITASKAQTITLPANNTFWHLYEPNGPYTPSHAKGVLNPAKYDGLTYTVLGQKPGGIYIVKTEDFGEGALWTNGTNAIIR